MLDKFKDIVENFIKEYGTDINNVKIVQSKYRTPIFADYSLAEKFKEYYEQVGILRLLTIEDHKNETKMQRKGKR